MTKQSITFSYIIFFIYFSSFSPVKAQYDSLQNGLQAITQQKAEAQLTFLASDWMEGRETGKKGCYIAADYIASMFQTFGLQKDTFDTDRSAASYFMNFPLLYSKPTKKHQLSIINNKQFIKQLDFKYNTDFQPIENPKYDMQGEFSVVFAGYGLVDNENGYNDYQKTDIENKIVLRFKGFPGHKDTNSIAYKKFAKQHSQKKAKHIMYRRNQIARSKGAAAVLVCDTKREQQTEYATNVFRYNTPDFEGDKPQQNYRDYSLSLIGNSFPNPSLTYSVSQRLAHEILKQTGLSPDAIENKIQASSEPLSQEIPDIRIKIKSTVETKIIKARNVIGVIPGQNPHQVVVVGAHYDHLGKYGGYIWNGADDNASGTVAVMLLAHACKQMNVKPYRTIIFAAWSGEEKGILGSSYFAKHHPYDTITACFNFDMISRNTTSDSTGNYFYIIYTSPNDTFLNSSKEYNTSYGINLEVKYYGNKQPIGGSDHSPFAMQNIPVFFYSTGWHKDYHKVTDHSDKANIEKMTRIIQLAFLSLWHAANKP